MKSSTSNFNIVPAAPGTHEANSARSPAIRAFSNESIPSPNMPMTTSSWALSSASSNGTGPSIHASGNGGTYTGGASRVVRLLRSSGTRDELKGVGITFMKVMHMTTSKVWCKVITNISVPFSPFFWD